MTPQVSFDGFIGARYTDCETFVLRVSDLYLAELRKWMCADAPAAGAPAFFNLQTLTSVRGFGFWTSTVDRARWSPDQAKTLQDFFE